MPGEQPSGCRALRARPHHRGIPEGSHPRFRASHARRRRTAGRTPCPPSTPRRPRSGVFEGSHPRFRASDAVPGDLSGGRRAHQARPDLRGMDCWMDRLPGSARAMPCPGDQPGGRRAHQTRPDDRGMGCSRDRIPGSAQVMPCQGSRREDAMPMITPPPPMDGLFGGSHPHFRASDAVPGEPPGGRRVRDQRRAIG